MNARKLVYYLVYPKTFHIDDFYSRGYYHCTIKLVAKDSNNNIIRGYPCFYSTNKDNNGRCNFIEVIIGQNRFHVRFTQQQVWMKCLPVFCIQYELHNSYQVYFEFNLYHTKIESTDKLAMRSKKVDSNTLFIVYNSTLDVFKRVMFTQPMYFCHLDVYIASAVQGYKLRLHSYQLLQFTNLSKQQKLSIAKIDKKPPPTIERAGKLIRKYFKIPDIEKFYKETIQKAVREYIRLCQIYQNYIMDDNLHTVQLVQQRNQIGLMDYYCLRVQEPSKSYNHTMKYQLKTNHKIYRNVRFLFEHLIKNLQLGRFQLFQYFFESFNKWQGDIKIQRLVIKTNYLTKITDQIRNNQKKYFLERRQTYLQSQNLYDRKEKYFPMICINSTQNNPLQTNQIAINYSLIVLVHGFQGSNLDMQKIKNYLAIYTKRCMFLYIQSIQNQMNEGIEELGCRVFEQIDNHLKSSLRTYSKISFIGFSLGGIIIRSALKHMKQYSQKIHILITLGSPHLGICYSQNSLVKFGVWMMKKIDKVKNLQELNLQLQSAEQSVMMKLSKSESLTWLKKMIVVSSKEDQFIPHYSSRIDEEHPDKQINQMSKNIRKRVPNIDRVEVWFDIDHVSSTLDKILGRRSHIEFLDNDKFIESLAQIYGHIF